MVWIPGIGKSADDRRYNVRETELRHGRDMFDDVITEKHSFRDEGARVTGDDWDGLGRVDVVAGDVVVAIGRVRVDNVRLAKVPLLYQLVVVAAHLVHLQARVLLCPNDLNSRKKIVRTTRQQQLYSQCQGLCDQSSQSNIYTAKIVEGQIWGPGVWVTRSKRRTRKGEMTEFKSGKTVWADM